MEILHKDDKSNGVFYVGEDHNRLAEMTYVWSDDTLIINHTKVSDALAGKGVGKKLVAQAVEYARSKKLTIMPTCSFARSVFDRVDEFKDVLI